MKEKIIDGILFLIATIATFAGYKIIVEDKDTEKEKIVFAYVDPESVQEQETDSYTVDGFTPDVK